MQSHAQSTYKVAEPTQKQVNTDALDASADNFGDDEPGAKAAKLVENVQPKPAAV